MLLDVKGGSYEPFSEIYQPNGLLALCGPFIYYLHRAGRPEPPCSIFFGYDLRVGLHIFVLTILKLQNAKDEKSYYQLGKNLVFNIAIMKKSQIFS